MGGMFRKLLTRRLSVAEPLLQVERIREMMEFLREEYPGGWDDAARRARLSER